MNVHPASPGKCVTRTIAATAQGAKVDELLALRLSDANPNIDPEPESSGRAKSAKPRRCSRTTGGIGTTRPRRVGVPDGFHETGGPTPIRNDAELQIHLDQLAQLGAPQLRAEWTRVYLSKPASSALLEADAPRELSIKISLSDISSIASLVSSIAVVISLFYLSIQIRQAQKNQRAIMQQGRSSGIARDAG
jgi:hypothetical protein